MATTVGNLLVKVSAKADNVFKTLDQVERRLYKTGRVLSGVGRDISQTITLPLVATGGAAIAAAADFEKLEKAMVSAMGDATAARREMQELKKVAQNPGLGFEQAVRGSVRLQAVRVDAETARQSLSLFGNAIALAGGSAADLDRVTLALSQIAAKGKVSAEEINQLAEVVPQIRAALQDAFGTADTEKLQKMGIDFTQFINGVNSSLATLPTASNTFANSFDNMRMAVRESLAEFGAVIIKSFDLQNVLERVSKKIQSAVEWFKSLSDSTKKTLLTITAIVAAIGPLLVALGSLNGLMRAGISVITLFGKASMTFLLTPVGLITTAIAALITLAIQLKNALDEVKDKWGELTDWVGQKSGKLLSLLPGTAGAMGDAVALSAEASRDARRRKESGFNIGAGATAGVETGTTGGSTPATYFEQITGAIEGTTGATTELGKSMKDLKTSYTDSFGQMREVTEEFNKSLLVSDGIMGLFAEKSAMLAQEESKPWFAKPESPEELAAFAESLSEVSSQMERNVTQGERQKELGEALKATWMDYSGAYSTAMSSVQQSAQKGIKSFGDFARAALKAAAEVVKASVIKSIAAVLADSFQKFGIIGGIVGGVASAGVSLLFDSFINKIQAPALASGGLAFGPTMAMVGDNQGAKTDPEVIAPLSKLKTMLGGGGNMSGTFRIDYKTLDLLLDLREERKNRFS